MKIIKTALIILVIIGSILIGFAAAHAVDWPSLSASSRCANGLTVFSLHNVGEADANAVPWSLSLYGDIYRNGLVWIGAHGSTEWWYDAPGLPLVFSYVRPDTGATVDIPQTCPAGTIPPAPEPTEEAQTTHFWYLPVLYR